MYNNEQLDMLIEHKENDKKIYIKYTVSGKQMRSNIVDKYVEDLYDLEKVLSKNDTLIIVSQDEPNDTLIQHMKHLYLSNGIFVVMNTLKRLQFNITNHSLVPPMTILDEESERQLLEKYNLKSKKDLAEISRFDPQAVALLMRPGEVGKFERNSITALNYDYYRICV